MSAFTEEQPRDGETVLHCGHIRESKHNHFFGFAEGLPEVPFCRPDGSQGKARWMILCEACFQAHASEPHLCIRGDAKWIGDAPAIKNKLS